MKVQMEVHPKEKELLDFLREKFRYGEVVVSMRDGLPYRIAKAVEYITIDGKLDNSPSI